MNCQHCDSVSAWLQNEIKPKVDSRIETILSNRQYGDQLQYQIDTGGKRLRPGLTAIVGTLCELPEREILDIAAGIELLHTFTLIHDDVMDNDRYRRGNPTVWVKWDKPSAVNFGDMLFAQSLRFFPDGYRDIALQTTIRMAEGQQMDLDFSTRQNVTVDEYIEMVRRKTGCLFDLCLHLPQIVSNTDLGIDGYSELWPAFQIRDDLLDFEEGKNRNRVTTDILYGKRTLMVAHANDSRIYKIIDKPAEKTTAADVEKVWSLFEEQGSITFARQEMNKRTENALASIEHLPDSDEKRMLQEIGQYFMSRTS